MEQSESRICGIFIDGVALILSWPVELVERYIDIGEDYLGW
jgi:hypothetical protein